jgi:hypothetical protein
LIGVEAKPSVLIHEPAALLCDALLRTRSNRNANRKARQTRRREAAFCHVATLCERVEELLAFVAQHTFGFIIGYQRRYPPCELVGKTKTDPIGGSSWNTLDRNCENFIRLQTRRRAGTHYLETNVEEPGRCTEITNKGTELVPAKDLPLNSATSSDVRPVDLQ